MVGTVPGTTQDVSTRPGASIPRRTLRTDELPDEGELAPGAVLVARYKIVEVIGRGGMGTVYLGEHLTVGRKVAIKVLTSQRSEAEDRRFRAEARAASAAGHPNIIEVFDAGALEDGRQFLVMEYLPGRSLYAELQQHGPLPPERACEIVRDVARAVRAAHGVGIIHRDLKPENVMLVTHRDGEIIKVLDFGVAGGVALAENGPRITRAGIGVGTPEYMAPEQAAGEQASERFDVYALGVMLYELLTGRTPFEASNIVELLTKKAIEDPPSLAAHRRDLPRDLIKLVDDSLATDPNKRPANLDLFLERLESSVGSALDRTEPIVTGASPVTTDHRTTWALLGLVAVAAVGAGAVWLSGEDPAGPAQVAEVLTPETVEADKGAPEPRPSPGRPVASADKAPTQRPAKAGRGSKLPEPAAKAVEPADDAGALPSVHDDPGSQPDAEPDTPKHESAGCQQLRADAKRAEQSGDWKDLLAAANKTLCWPKGVERRKLRTRALMELGQYAACAGAGAGISDPQVKAWVKRCQEHSGSE